MERCGVGRVRPPGPPRSRSPTSVPRRASAPARASPLVEPKRRCERVRRLILLGGRRTSVGAPLGAPPARPSKTSSTSRGASLSLLKREAAARGPGARRAPARASSFTRRRATTTTRATTAAADDDVRGGDIRESANPRAPRSGRRGERNASVYTRLLRESRRPPRASATANEISAAPVVPEPPRVSRGDPAGTPPPKTRAGVTGPTPSPTMAARRTRGMNQNATTAR